MSALVRRRPRRTLLLGAGLAGAAVLTGCGAQGATGEAAEVAIAPAADTAAAPSGDLADVADLSAGLLPADAFGAGRVVPLTAEQLAQQAAAYGGSMAGAVDGLSVTPDGCRTALEALKGTRPDVEDSESLEGFAAQLAKADGTTPLTVEVLAAGPLVADAVDRVVAGVTACPEATVSAPALGSATVAFQTLDTPDLGDDAVTVSVTATVTRAGGQPITAPVLVGMVQDGDRLVTLLSTGPDAALDADAFLALLERAHEHQADALD
jgi:hypothetical protein